MMKAAIVIDRWKLKIFKKNLEKAGYFCDSVEGPGRNVLTLTIDFKEGEADILYELVNNTNAECARSKMN